MSLNREQIINGLKCCEREGDCDQCSYKSYDTHCTEKLCNDAHALINELTEENDTLKYQMTLNIVIPENKGGD